MFQSMPWRVPVWGTVVLLSIAQAAFAQGYPTGPICNCVQPVVQQCYQTVPVTEYRSVKQTVQQPVIETKYVDRQVTEYHPVTETRTAEVPTVTYQNVTEYKSGCRDCGRWITQYHAKPRCSPCEYDQRADLMGWLNRTGYSLRMAFTPKYTTTRQYVPNMVAYTYPVTRRVAINGSRKVAYNVTRMVPKTTTRKVAVNSVRYVAKEITTMRPVTVMRTVPTGTRMAYVPFSAGSTQTALAPIADPSFSAGAASPQRTADRENDEVHPIVPAEKFKRTAPSSPGPGANNTNTENERSSIIVPKSISTGEKNAQIRTDDGRVRAEEEQWQVVTIPSAVRVHRWTARNRTTVAAGPSLGRTPLSAANPTP